MLRLWSRFLKGLRIRERIYANVDPDEELNEVAGLADKDDDAIADQDITIEDALSDVSEEVFMVEDDEGGGFVVE